MGQAQTRLLTGLGIRVLLHSTSLAEGPNPSKWNYSTRHKPIGRRPNRSITAEPCKQKDMYSSLLGSVGGCRGRMQMLFGFYRGAALGYHYAGGMNACIS